MVLSLFLYGQVVSAKSHRRSSSHDLWVIVERQGFTASRTNHNALARRPIREMVRMRANWCSVTAMICVGVTMSCTTPMGSGSMGASSNLPKGTIRGTTRSSVFVVSNSGTERSAQTVCGTGMRHE